MEDIGAELTSTSAQPYVWTPWFEPTYPLAKADCKDRVHKKYHMNAAKCPKSWSSIKFNDEGYRRPNITLTEVRRRYEESKLLNPNVTRCSLANATTRGQVNHNDATS